MINTLNLGLIECIKIFFFSYETDKLKNLLLMISLIAKQIKLKSCFLSLIYVFSKINIKNKNY